MGLREEKREATKEQIVTAAALLFTKRGFEETTIDDIAREAKVAKGTFYYHFKTKEEVVMAFGTAALGKTIEQTDTLLASGSSPLDCLRSFLAEVVKWYEKNRQLVRVMFMHAFSKTQTYAICSNRPSVRYTFLRLITAGQEVGQIRSDISPVELAQMLGMLFVQATFAWLEEPKSLSLRKRVDLCLTLFLEGAQNQNKQLPKRD